MVLALPSKTGLMEKLKNVSSFRMIVSASLTNTEKLEKMRNNLFYLGMFLTGSSTVNFMFTLEKVKTYLYLPEANSN